MKKAFIIIPVIILAVLLAVVAFYSVPFVKANSLIVSANKSDQINAAEENDLISPENYAKLRIIDRNLSESEYVNLKTGKKFDFVGLTRLDLKYSVTAKIDSLDEIITPETHSGSFVISFSFTKGKWRVSAVTASD